MRVISASVHFAIGEKSGGEREEERSTTSIEGETEMFFLLNASLTPSTRTTQDSELLLIHMHTHTDRPNSVSVYFCSVGKLLSK